MTTYKTIGTMDVTVEQYIKYMDSISQETVYEMDMTGMVLSY